MAEDDKLEFECGECGKVFIQKSDKENFFHSVEEHLNESHDKEITREEIIQN